MATENPLEIAKEVIVEVVNRFAEAQKNELLKAISGALQNKVENKTGKPSDNKGSWAFKLGLIVFGMILLALISSVLILAKNAEFFNKLDASGLFQLIGFVFALSSYLATVARETATTLSAAKIDYKKYIEIKKNIFCMLIAEMSLILLGVLAIFRLIFGSGTWFLQFVNKCISFDAFLFSFLAVILICLAIIHVRIWWIYPAWSFRQK